MARRLTAYAPRPVSEARLGFNCGSTLTKAALEKVAECGAEFVRFQPAWDVVEDYGTGALSLPTSMANALTYCSELGLVPILTAAYGAPRSTVLELTVGSTVPVGSYVIPISAGGPSGVVVGTDFAQRKDGPQIVAEGKWTYYGGLIAAKESASITLAAKTTVELKAGDIIKVQRVRYAPLNGNSPTQAGVVGYLRYATYLAEQIAAHGCEEGYVGLWNEDAWSHDLWNHMAQLYDDGRVPEGVTETTRGWAVLEAALAADLPDGVRFINGYSGKTGASAVYPHLSVSADQVADIMAADDIHPYGTNPENGAWDPRDGYEVVNAANLGANFPGMGKSHDQATNGIGIYGTECGIEESNEVRQAVHLLRRVASLWGMRIPPVVYALAEGGSYSVLKGDLSAKASFTALKRLMGIVDALGGPGGNKRSVPALIGSPERPWPLVNVGLYGESGGLALVWQRTFEPTPESWHSVATPSTYSAQFYVPSGYSVKEALNLRTGSTVTPVVSGRRVTLPGVGEDVVALVTH